jgi:hypothetical protein
MKRLSFFVLIASAVTTFSIISCNKDELARSFDGTFIDTAPAPYSIDLVADHWNKIVQGVYACTFTNTIPSAYRNNRGVKVYLVKDGQKIQIDYPIHFMDGELSATTSTSDVTINYRCYAELPFDHLRIAVEIS